MQKLAELKSIDKLAVIQTAFLGDIALSLYLPSMVKSIAPNIEITFVTTPLGASFALCSKSIDEVISFDKRGKHSGWKGMRYIADELNKRQVKCILSPHRSLRTTLITSMSNADYKIGFDKNSLSFLYSRRVKYRLGIHEIERNAQLLSVFRNSDKLGTDQVDVEMDISEKDRHHVEKLLADTGINNECKIAAISPGSVWATKRWLPEYFIDLCKKLKEIDVIPVIVGSVNDIELASKIGSEACVISIAGKTSISQFIYFLSSCVLTISNDSSSTHFAGLVKCPVITLYGSTSPEFGFYPRGVRDKTLGIDGLKCRPCSIHGGDKCPIRSFKCMKELKPDIVFETVKSML